MGKHPLRVIQVSVDIRAFQATLVRAVFQELKDYLDIRELKGSQAIQDITEKAVTQALKDYPVTQEMRDYVDIRVTQALKEFQDIQDGVVTKVFPAIPGCLDCLVTLVYKASVDIVEFLVIRGFLDTPV